MILSRMADFLNPWARARKRRARIEAELEQVRVEAAERGREAKLKELADQARRYPVRKMTRTELAELQAQSESIDLNTCPLWTWFAYKRSPLPNTVIVGQIVPRDKVPIGQWGSGLSAPERLPMNYLVEIVEEPEIAAAE